MKIVIKRVVAYIIDIILVSLVATFLTSNAYINKDYEKYTKTYEEYTKYSNEYKDFITDVEDISKDDEISDKDFTSLINNYPNYKEYLLQTDDGTITNKDRLNDIKDIIDEHYKLTSEDYAYRLIKLSIIQKIISVLCILMYFVVIQYFLNGQTLGKKLMKLRVRSNSDKELTILNYFIRSLILNEVVITMLNVICSLTFSKGGYIIYNQIIYYVTYVIEMTILFMVMFDKNSRGLHDYAANTKVVDLGK